MISVNRAMAMLDRAGDSLGAGIAANGQANEALAMARQAAAAKVHDAMQAMAAVNEAIDGAREILAALMGAGFEPQSVQLAHSMAMEVHQNHKHIQGLTSATMEHITAEVDTVRELYNQHQAGIADLVRAISDAKGD